MGIEANFDMKGIQDFINGKLDLLNKAIVRDLGYLGMQCIIKARTLNTYTDRTSNLRNSIGYVIAKHGTVIDSVFPNDTSGTENGKGKKTGEDYAKELANQFPFGYSLIIVAGMEYASYVEDVRHYEVLEPAKALARMKEKDIAEKIMKSLKSVKSNPKKKRK